MIYIVGLGNPGEEYENTRHNTGALSVESFAKKNKLATFENNKKLKAFVTEGKIGKQKIELLLPQGFMNKSGLSIKPLITSKKKAENLVVIYDDLDMPLGKIKISFGRGSGGHKGIESIVRSIKTKDFIRIRVGIAPATPSGKIKKIKTEQKVIDFILGDFKKKETEILKKVFKKVNEALEVIIKEGRSNAMNEFNR
ncbi:aminoacyl-tRNA hydrolase [bacterium]|jgi:peptidyl-tRNA hydrolase, PTH1 family|nr:aminoacyl-tRNA hydrolase [bacterium]MBT3729995.1 aminoacyl-tRNA hydrolase [bacterium]MBT4894539.1 aminoacyl-tRNA hydrolase [bacterium]